MRLKIVLHIKIQFVNSNFLTFSKIHFRKVEMITAGVFLPPCGHFVLLHE